MDFAKYDNFLDKLNDTKNNNLKFDKRLEKQEIGQQSYNDEKYDFNPDKRKEVYYSSLEERIKYTPKEDSSNGSWQHERGKSLFISNNQEVNQKLKAYGMEGIKYREGIPNFKPCAIVHVKIENMTTSRKNNFDQADSKMAEQWNRELKDNRSDWKSRESKEYRENNNLTWHEQSNTKDMLLLDHDIHKEFIHSGGCSECGKRDNMGGLFDE